MRASPASTWHGRADHGAVPPVCRPALLAALTAAAVLGNLAGFLFFFDRVWSFDKLMHFYTSFVAGLAIAVTLRAPLLARLRASPALIVLIVGAFGIALGVLWELAEWAVDLHKYPAIIMGKSDTMFDLIADGLGAFLAGLLAARSVRYAGHDQG